MNYYGAIEAGGTKCVCAICDKDLNILARVSIPTTSPAETMAAVFDFFAPYPLTAMGIGSFGPIEVNKNAPAYGHITTTPKPGWGGYDFVGSVKAVYNIPVAFSTDVNAAALGELARGAAQGLDSCVYLTVGTGIGGGAVVKGQLLEGWGHPEMGHILVNQHPDDTYIGACPYHGNCLEGLAAGPALEKRWGQPAITLAPDHQAWVIEADYLAQALMSYVLTLSPERIILGGGVMKQTQLFPLIRQALQTKLNGYITLPELESFIVPPALGDNAGITGCLLMAQQAIQ